MMILEKKFIITQPSGCLSEKIGIALMFLALACNTHAASAASVTSSAANLAVLEEIVVTAQKRSQKLSDVGITIVAATGDQLDTAGVADVSELSKVTPGFSVGSTTLGYKVFSLRGINFNAAQVSAPPAVSAYVDEAPLPYSAMTGMMLLDVERVEVLKGPQGTLFGQNSTGGSINVIAAKPTDHLTVGVSTEINNFGQTMLEGYVSGPLSDTFRARLAGTTTQGGAWQKGYYLNNHKNGDQDKAAARLLLDWTPTEQLTVSLNLNGGYDKSEQQQSQLSRILTPFGPVGPAPGLIGYPIGTRNRDADVDPSLSIKADTRQYQAVLRADYSFTDDLKLTSITNYVSLKSHSTRNLDGTAVDILNSGTVGNVETFSQEVRLAGALADSKLHYIVGGNFDHDKMDDNVLGFLDNYSFFPPGAAYQDNFKPTNRAVAGFGNIDYEIAPKLTLTAGARYTKVKEETTGCLLGNAGFAAALGGVPGQCLTLNDNLPTPATANYAHIATGGTQDEHNVSWRAGLNYKPTSDSLIYGLVSRGFKAGVFPAQPNIINSESAPVTQEELTSYEIGTKLAFFDRALLLNVSTFYYDYKDKQFYTFTLSPLVGASSLIVNIPKSNVKGFDADITASPITGLTLRAAVTYVKTSIKNFTSIDFKGNPLVATDKQFNFAPPWSGTADADYRFPIASDLDAYVGASALFNSTTYADLGEPAQFRIPSYMTVDARFGVESNKGWRVGVFVRNLADENYWTTVVPSGDTNTRLAGMPRTYGVTAGYKF
jgi:iron complex outermembrane recepter protein